MAAAPGRDDAASCACPCLASPSEHFGFGSCSSGCASAVGPWCLRLLAQGSNPAASCTTLFPGFTSLLALCGPESRTPAPAPAPAPAFHGPAHTRPRLYLRYLLARVSSCLPPLLPRRICCDLRLRPATWRGPAPYRIPPPNSGHPSLTHHRRRRRCRTPRRPQDSATGLGPAQDSRPPTQRLH